MTILVLGGAGYIGSHTVCKLIDGVIHFTVSFLVGENMSDPLKCYNNNLYGTMVLQAPNGKREKSFVLGDDYPTEDGACI